MLSKTKPWAHQQAAYDFAINKPAVGLFMEMGTGKTKVAIDLVVNRCHRRTLIVCPLSVVSVWPEEFERHAALLPQIVTLDNPFTAKKANHLLQVCQTSSPLVVVVNYDSVWREPLSDVITKVGFDCVIMDESHRIKAAGSKVSKFAAYLGKKVPWRICLTGTPLAHSPLDIYGQYRFLDPTIFGTRFDIFRNQYAVMGGYGGYQILRYQHLDELHEKMYQIAFRVRADEVLDLPDNVDMVRRFRMSPQAQAVYRQLSKEFMAAVDNGTITANNALTRILRLQQITSGYVPVDYPGGKHMKRLDTGRRDTLIDILEDIAGSEPVVIFYQFRQDRETISEVAGKIGRKCWHLCGGENQIADWNKSPTGDILAVQIQAGNAGINLTKAKYCIYYNKGHSLEQYEQSRFRIRRPGQTRAVTYIHIEAEYTIDQIIARALANKKDIVTFVMDTFREQDLTI